MANELQLYTDANFYSGKTIEAQIYLDGVKVGSNIATVESGVSGVFIGDMPLVDANVYAVRFIHSGDIIGQGEIYWNGENEEDTADLVYNKINPEVIDPLKQFHVIETYFKSITKYNSLNYVIKLNNSLETVLKAELDSDPLDNITVFGYVLTVVIDNSLSGYNFVIYGS